MRVSFGCCSEPAHGVGGESKGVQFCTVRFASVLGRTGFVLGRTACADRMHGSDEKLGFQRL